MIKIISYFVKNKLVVFLLIFLIICGGLASFLSSNREGIPNVSFDMVKIQTTYPGASPNEAEELISIPIERTLRQVDGIDKIRSYNIENVSVVVVYVDDYAKDKRKVVQDVKDKVDVVTNLPAGASKPIAEEITVENTEIITVAFTGKTKDVPYDKLRRFAKESEDFFYDIEGVAKMDKWGYYDREYLVEVNPEAIERYRIGMNTLINKLKMRNVDSPGGSIKFGKNEFILRTTGKFENADENRNTVILGNDSGFATRIRDVAKVTDTYEDADIYHSFGGKEAVLFRLYKKSSADEIDLSKRIHDIVSTYSLPGFEDVEVSLFNDRSVITKSRLEIVMQSALIGAVLLAILMFILLGKRLGFLVVFSIPLSFCLNFISMKYFGSTINIISMFGMIMVLGMVVDASIVVSENTYRHMELGKKRFDSVILGVKEIIWPETVAIMCIITTFSPLLLLTGIMGKFIHDIPLVLISSLIASWFIAMFILPTLLDLMLDEVHVKKKSFRERLLEKLKLKKPGKASIAMSSATNKKATAKKVQVSKTKVNKEEKKDFFEKFQNKFRAFLNTALAHRYLSFLVLLVLFFGSMACIGIFGFRFMPEGGEESMKVKINYPNETNLDANLELTRNIEKIALTIPETELMAVHSFVGEESSTIMDPKPGYATYKTTIEVKLCPERDRTRIAAVIRDELRDKIVDAQKKGLVTKNMNFRVELDGSGPSIGKPVNVEIRGKDFTVIKKIAKEYSDYLATMKGLRNISCDLEDGKKEYR